jgi:dipeptidyl aminopeptidase/acylaminoacyl peptidase
MDRENLAPAEEVRREVSAFEGAIEYLDRVGLIEPTRVGIIGFSRTCMYVKYALTHSKYAFAAASVADGVDAGYFQYIAFSNIGLGVSFDAEAINGGPPFGEALSSWLKESPGFNLDRVRTPVRIEAIGSGSSSLLTEWEWFSGLSRLAKPVEMIYLPDGTHTLEKPWEREASLQGNVDWFAFWLKDEENDEPADREQYSRWRQLRLLQGRSLLHPGEVGPALNQ